MICIVCSQDQEFYWSLSGPDSEIQVSDTGHLNVRFTDYHLKSTVFAPDDQVILVHLVSIESVATQSTPSLVLLSTIYHSIVVPILVI
jgi:hypothetical protein